MSGEGGRFKGDPGRSWGNRFRNENKTHAELRQNEVESDYGAGETESKKITLPHSRLAARGSLQSCAPEMEAVNVEPGRPLLEEKAGSGPVPTAQAQSQVPARTARYPVGTRWHHAWDT